MSPKLLRVRLTTSVRVSAERSAILVELLSLSVYCKWRKLIRGTEEGISDDNGH